ncbi:hypothetical protein SARC_03389 [Sphaeroforma arctica JP610]|uniref:Uncharacterized protein n=1 Tax=Sphaeroforma arctica JP610 TaxID=667725 RepID=A0A0L0G6A0_9EUKA|nr:hypothetical protein SARC_03389 [Sphaeroforma arctica JP610]KNC84396.1 hypothetical protein SARC_03389 [Sphaeroforma arctica JP610]|eukprot:XP_014158298.1 hypothetical protein SARC_03389 [Sphaeroforma arctica JP610]
MDRNFNTTMLTAKYIGPFTISVADTTSGMYENNIADGSSALSTGSPRILTTKFILRRICESTALHLFYKLKYIIGKYKHGELHATQRSLQMGHNPILFYTLFLSRINFYLCRKHFEAKLSTQVEAVVYF